MKKNVLSALLFVLALASYRPAQAQTAGATFGVFGYAAMPTGTTGGAGGTTVTVSTGTALQAAINNKGTQPLTIYINGTITLANSPGLTKIDVKNVSNLSIIGFDRLEITGNRIVPTNCANAIGSVLVLATRPGTGPATPQVLAYPNPTAKATTFEITLPTASPVHITLFSLTGAKVAEVPAGAAVLGAGTHRIEYQHAQLPAGVYFYEVRTDNGTTRARLLVE